MFATRVSQGKSTDTSIMYYSNKTFSGLFRGAGVRMFKVS